MIQTGGISALTFDIIKTVPRFANLIYKVE